MGNKIKGKGLVYILSNPSFSSDMLKIGMTRRTARDRADELYRQSTGIPEPFEVEYELNVSNCVAAEEVIHKRLVKFRKTNSREFFKIPIELAISIIKNVVDEVDAIYSDREIVNNHKIQINLRENGFKSTNSVDMKCSKCFADIKSTLTRYENQVACPECKTINELDIIW